MKSLLACLITALLVRQHAVAFKIVGHAIRGSEIEEREKFRMKPNNADSKEGYSGDMTRLVDQQQAIMFQIRPVEDDAQEGGPSGPGDEPKPPKKPEAGGKGNDNAAEQADVKEPEKRSHRQQVGRQDRSAKDDIFKNVVSDTVARIMSS